MHTPKEGFTFFGISGINFPIKKREYLMELLKEAAEKHKPNFVIVAGNTIAGNDLEKELKAYTNFESKEVKKASKELSKEIKSLGKNLKDAVLRLKKTESERDKQELRQQISDLESRITNLTETLSQFDNEDLKRKIEEEFIESQARDLNNFLPKLKGSNYHIVISEKVYDRQIGVQILEKLKEMRNDIRLIGKRQDGSYDPEPKIASSLKGFEEIRVIIPRSRAWFSRIITTTKQNLINKFVGRTFSPPPSMILVGCAGIASYIPYYEGIPCIAVPTIHKIDEQTSTENMVGISVIKIISENGKIRIVNGVYDFRPAIFNERQLAIPEAATRMERAVLKAFLPSDASFKIILFRIKTARKKNKSNGVDKEKVQAALDSLIKQKVVRYNPQSNRYAINEELIQRVDISLKRLFEDSKTVKHTVISCFHCGCLKSLYHTTLKYLPLVAKDSDALIENGDGIQGIAHNYEYNGELLPITYGFDKQEILLANIRARNILDIFKLKYADLKDKKIEPAELLRKCFIFYVSNDGNHPYWKHYHKDALIFELFETKLKQYLVEGLFKILNEFGIRGVDYELVKSIVNEKVIRVGESRMVNLNGVVVGVKHPFKSRSASKSHRIQDVVDFLWRNFSDFSQNIVKNVKGFSLVDVANFHEAASVHVVKFGRTTLGLMTGAYLRDTSFESNQDKVVDRGSANVMAVISKEDKLLYSEVEFDNWIHPEDKRIVFADRVKTSDVNKLCTMLTNEFVDVPWR